ncbi:MAG: class I SAM-dependent RNA methyltransferase [Sphingomonadales bacterium]
MAEIFTISHLAARGDGVALTPEGPLYVPFSAPGDEVRRDGEAVSVVRHGPNRQTPACPHFGPCGGCALQHVDDRSYRAWLADRVRVALAQQNVEAASIEAAEISPSGGRRRCAWQARWHQGHLHLGYSGRASHDTVDLTACPVLEPQLLALAGPLRELFARHLPRRRAGRVQLLASETGVDLLIEGLEADRPEMMQDLSKIFQTRDLARISLLSDGHAEIALMARAPVLTIGRATVRPAPGAFVQPTKAGEQSLQQALRDGLAGCRRIADLFAGLGSFSLVAAEWASVHAVEGQRAALAALEAARGGGHGLKPITTAHRDLFRRPLTTQELASFDAVIVDPPRAGALAQVANLAATRVGQLMMISCNPNTFARDARLLVDGGYNLAWVRPVGQFLWSREVELAALFVR